MRKNILFILFFCVSLWCNLGFKKSSFASLNSNSFITMMSEPTSNELASKNQEILLSGFFQNFKDRLLALKNTNWFYSLVIIFIAGIITSLTPCVLPMIPITLSAIGTRRTESKREAFLLSLIYVLGISSIYSLLGLLAALTGSLFGAFLGHPLVVIFFTLIFIVLALSLFGLFELQLPKFISQRLHNYSSSLNQKKMNWVIVFLLGVLAGFVASPCVGPLLAALLLYVAKIQNPIFGFLLLFTFSFGLGQMFLFLGIFGQWSIPKIGVWMKRIQYLLGIALLFLAFNFVFPLFNNGSHLFNFNEDLISKKEKLSEEEYKKEVSYGYQWVLFSKKALEQAKKDRKPVIIDFYASWCLACLRLERSTFSDPEVSKIGQNFLWLKLNVTKLSDEKKKILKEFDVFGLPTVLIFDSLGERREDLTLRGFEKPDLFIKRMEKVIYKKENQDQT